MGKLLELLGPLLQVLGQFVEFVKNRSKATLITIGAVAVVAAFAAGALVKLPDWHSEGGGTLLGGVDLAGYCVSYGFDSGSDQDCFSKIDLNDACDWQYSQAGMYIVFTSPSPYSGVCYTRKHKRLQGIDAMDEYCAAHYKSSADVVSKPTGKRTWVCQTAVDMDLVCNWKWQKIDVVARRIGDANWKCYEKD